MNYEDIPGNEVGRRAIEIAIVGHHSVLFIGGPRTEAAELEKFVWSIYTADYSVCQSRWPCPCGNLLDPEKECVCTYQGLRSYTLDTFIFDRDFDITVEVKELRPEELLDGILGKRKGESWDRVKARIAAMTKYDNLAIDQTSYNLLKAATLKIGFNSTQIRRILAVARTIANLAQSEKIQTAHLAEAIQYRPPNYFKWLSSKKEEENG